MASRKGKRRNSEKRKEKSRDAARNRRNKEADVFSDLAKLLPLSHSQSLQQDKASIMRLAISHLKLRKILGAGMTSGDYLEYDNSLQRKLDVQYSKALEGFALVLARAGDMVFLSENVSKYLGLTQLDLIGHSVFDYTHPCDHDEIREILAEKAHSPTGGNKEERNFLMRMKCTLTSKGRNINLKSATYKVLLCSGRYVVPGPGSRHFPGLNDGQTDSKSMASLLLVAEPIPHPANIEVPLDSQTFISRHNLDMKITHCDNRITQLLGYDTQEIMNQSIFDFHHALDTEIIREACKSLFSKGQAVITQYRFLAREGGYCWMQTEATVINNQRTDKPTCVVCVNYVLSDIEEKHLILSSIQTKRAPSKVPLAIKNCANTEPSVPAPRLPALSSGPTMSTESIFVQPPIDAERELLQMNKVQNLEQLAPAAGDAMVPLAFMNDDEQIYKDVEMMTPCYNGALSGQPSPVGNCSKSSTPFSNNSGLTVLDMSFLRNETSGLISNVQSAPAVSESGMDNQVKATNLGIDFKPDTTFSEEFDDVEFEMRAPFITMDGSDDKTLDQNWIPLWDDQIENCQMLGITETVFAPKPPEPVENEEDKHKVPLSILRLQAANKMNDASDGDISRNAGPPKMKRPMETNRLEHGPPHAKSTKTNVEPPNSHHNIMNGFTTPKGKADVALPEEMDTESERCSKSLPAVKNDQIIINSGSSVLKNLLTTGQDISTGYKITQAKQFASHRQKENSSLKALLLSDDTSSEEEEVDDPDDIDIVFATEGILGRSADLPPPVPTLPKILTNGQGFSQSLTPNNQGNSSRLVTVIPAGSQGATVNVMSVTHACNI